MDTKELKEVLSRILAPLIEADGGKLYWVADSTAPVRLHITGKFSGCPGNQLVQTAVIQPVLDRLAEGIQVELTSGPLLPEGAQALAPTAQPS